MIFAAVHLDPLWTIAAASVVGAWTIWYWFRLGRADVPSSRRKIRRISLLIMLLSLPVFVRALSFIDPQVQQREYIMTWSVAFVMMLIVIVIAAVDAVNSMRLMHRHTHDEMREAAADLSAAIKEREKMKLAAAQHKPTTNGKHH